MTWIRSLLALALLGVAVFSYPVAEELISDENDGDYQYDEVESKPEETVKRGDIAGSGAEPGKKDEVKPVTADTSKVVDNPESDESESPASGDAAVSGNGASEELEDTDATTRDGVAEAADQEDAGSTEEGSGAGSDIVKKDKVASKRDKDEKEPCKKCEKRDCECKCEEDEPDEEHEHHHEHCGHENCCHGDHEDEHHHEHEQGHQHHDDCCHHHGHHHGFVHEWGEECCGDHDHHDCCGEHEHCHHDNDDHDHEHCCHDQHCCHHKEEEEEPHHCCCDKRSKTKGKENTKRTVVPQLEQATSAQVSPSVVKKQTVHVGYGYASGDNYRLGYQQGGMGGLASTFTGQIGAEQQGSYDADHFNKRRTVSYVPRGPVRQKRFYSGHAFGNMESGMAHGSATPYGHPVTHPGFTTMGFPGHALASQDVRNTIIHPHMKRSIIYDEAIPYEAIPYAYAIHYSAPY